MNTPLPKACHSWRCFATLRTLSFYFPTASPSLFCLLTSVPPCFSLSDCIKEPDILFLTGWFPETLVCHLLGHLAFRIKIIFLTSTPHLLDSLACHVVSRMNLGSGTLVASEGRGENNCYGQTGTPIFEKFWLIRNANVNCTLVWKRKGPNGHRQRSLCLNFLDVP